MKVIQLKTDFLRAMKTNSCQKLLGSAHIYLPTFDIINFQKATNETIDLAFSLLHSMTHLLAPKMPRFFEFLEVRLNKAKEEKSTNVANLSRSETTIPFVFEPNDFSYVLAKRRTHLAANSSTSEWTSHCPDEFVYVHELETVWVCKPN